jgi:hypothetical protein
MINQQRSPLLGKRQGISPFSPMILARPSAAAVSFAAKPRPDGGPGLNCSRRARARGPPEAGKSLQDALGVKAGERHDVLDPAVQK